MESIKEEPEIHGLDPLKQKGRDGLVVRRVRCYPITDGDGEGGGGGPC